MTKPIFKTEQNLSSPLLSSIDKYAQALYSGSSPATEQINTVQVLNNIKDKLSWTLQNLLLKT